MIASRTTGEGAMAWGRVGKQKAIPKKRVQGQANQVRDIIKQKLDR